MATHLAAVSLAKDSPFEVQSRTTPHPGPGELLIAVKSIALNPADLVMRKTGLFIAAHPAITGFDISGLVLAVGQGVPPCFEPGVTRIAAYAAAAFKGCTPDYGAFQERCLVPWQHAAPLPEGTSWNQAATLPVSVQVPLSAWDALGLPRPEQPLMESSSPKEALLVWGASSSVGSMGVQTARLVRDRDGAPIDAVYAVAGKANHEYVSSLGADRVFDYKDPDVVEAITAAAREDGLIIRHCFLATGQLELCQAVLKTFVGEGQEEDDHKAKIASAPVIPADAAAVEGVETIFLMPSLDEEARLAQYKYWMGTFLGENLAKRVIRPSPEPRVVGKGIQAINAGLDVLEKGVSCAKLVIEVAE
ncbi:chaperonin 10-like protein [Plectosphaerella plurivora]|uniref:Chaperonin 10-like protein n=1 Tax=Plectosphaerella plurivora TaxID=936078 RepID=A0A9P9AGW3_9PEZI|nr:chaperonin 10-like protein [Plectosphaerella plurivora]